MFSFPLLTNAEILACLDELELGFTEAMLLNPEKHRDEVRNVFEQLAELCCGLSRGLTWIDYLILNSTRSPSWNWLFFGAWRIY